MFQFCGLFCNGDLACLFLRVATRTQSSVCRYNYQPTYSTSHNSYSGAASTSSYYSPRSNLPHYDPYAPPRRPTVPSTTTAPSTSTSPGNSSHTKRKHGTEEMQPSLSSRPLSFMSSEQYLVSLSVQVPHCLRVYGTMFPDKSLAESTSQMDRKAQSLTFQITPEVLSKLQSTR